MRDQERIDQAMQGLDDFLARLTDERRLRRDPKASLKETAGDHGEHNEKGRQVEHLPKD